MQYFTTSGIELHAWNNINFPDKNKFLFQGTIFDMEEEQYDGKQSENIIAEDNNSTALSFLGVSYHYNYRNIYCFPCLC